LFANKHSPQAWYGKLSTALVMFGFKMGKSNHSLFVKKNSKGIVVVLSYIDDIVITGDNLQEVKTLKNYLHEKFNIKDLG